MPHVIVLWLATAMQRFVAASQHPLRQLLGPQTTVPPPPPVPPPAWPPPLWAPPAFEAPPAPPERPPSPGASPGRQVVAMQR
ncbi:MAG: hypothetical protein JNK82_00545 [Myxococcaceae bacterium]|nr:hypothetical protein [Myxococcaceae bacterium]